MGCRIKDPPGGYELHDVVLDVQTTMYTGAAAERSILVGGGVVGHSLLYKQGPHPYPTPLFPSVFNGLRLCLMVEPLWDTLIGRREELSS
jgi:hypothetical protein